MNLEGHYNLAVLLRRVNRNRESIAELEKMKADQREIERQLREIQEKKIIKAIEMLAESQ